MTAGVILWLSQLAAALLLAALLRVKDAGTTPPPSLPEPSAGNFFGSLRGSLGILGGICGTVILCSGLFPLLDFLPLSPLWDWTVRGMAEVTNGCFCLPEGVSGFGIFCRLGFFAAFGGICVFCQNALLVSGTGHFPEMVPGQQGSHRTVLRRVLRFGVLFPAPADCGVLRNLFRSGGSRRPFRRHAIGQRADGGAGNLFVVKRRKT